MPASIPQPYRAILGVLLAGWLALVLGGPIVMLLAGHPGHLWSLPSRLAQSALVLAAALALALGTTRQALHTYPWLILAGMAFGHVGDWNFGGVLGLPEPVVLGMLVFGIGHVLYMTAYRRLGRALGLENWQAVALGIVGFLLLTLVAWATLIRNPAKGPLMNYGALGYGFLLGAMAGWAAGLAAQDRRFTPLALGGVLFLTSDLFLGAQALRDLSFPRLGEIIWGTYIVGQALIVASTLTALRLLETPSPD